MIFCVEDDLSIRDIEVYTLNSTGFAAEGYTDGQELFRALKEKTPELIILDVMLPGDDGITILKKLKNNSSTAQIPIIMATAKGAEYDKIIGLDLGADDYLVKPFGMMEMVSRVRAVLRRAKPKDNIETMKISGLVMNLQEHVVTIDNKKIELTMKEFEMLRVFMSHIGMVFTRDLLLTDIWGMDYDGETRTVDVHVRTLRQKLEKYGELIETVRGIGYKLEVNQ